MLLDRANNFETVAVAAGQEAQLLGSHIATNHQSDSHWPLYEEKVLTHARFEHLHNVTAGHQHSAQAFTREFLQPPLYHTNFARGFGTLYDAAFYPQRLGCEYFWPHNEWQFDFHSFTEREYPIVFTDPEGYPENSEAYSEIYTSKPIPVLQF
jgi:predicted choloylglycine hydrolase